MIGIALLLSGICAADEPTADTAAHEAWQKRYQAIAESITMRHGQTRLPLASKPLLFYTNPVRGNDQHGAIFLWTDAGRPGVIGSIWSAVNRQNPASRIVTHEWHSLEVDSEVSATRKEKSLWTSGEPGVVWEAIRGAPPPAASRATRLTQMRTLVRNYAARIQDDGESELRLMAQPLYRYPEQVPEILDGAVFSCALTTDPELLVLLEGREEAGKAVWHVSFARFGNKAMTVKQGEQTVWSCKAGAPGVSDGKYYLRWRAEEMPAIAEPEKPKTEN